MQTRSTISWQRRSRAQLLLSECNFKSWHVWNVLRKHCQVELFSYYSRWWVDNRIYLNVCVYLFFIWFMMTCLVRFDRNFWKKNKQKNIYLLWYSSPCSAQTKTTHSTSIRPHSFPHFSRFWEVKEDIRMLRKLDTLLCTAAWMPHGCPVFSEGRV